MGLIRRAAGLVVAGVLMAAMVTAQPTALIVHQNLSSVATAGALPGSGRLGDVILLRDSAGLVWWNGTTWADLTVSGTPGPAGPQGDAGAAGADGLPHHFAKSGSVLPDEPTLNLTGSSVSCADNPGASRTDCAFSGGGGGGGVSGPDSSTSIAFPRFADTTGGALLDSAVTADDDGNTTIPDGAGYGWSDVILQRVPGPVLNFQSRDGSSFRSYRARGGYFFNGGPGSPILVAKVDYQGAFLAAGGYFGISGSFSDAEALNDVRWSRLGAGAWSADTTVTGDGAATVYLGAVRYTPSSGWTCDSSTKGLTYVASGDGSFCSCNGATWTPAPITGVCN